MTLLRSTIYDDATYAVLQEIGYRGPCRCFDRTGLYDGHDVNPKCETVLWAERLIKAARSVPGASCECWTCHPSSGRMHLCETCGNKRCPKATDHSLECTNSNEPMQEGSRYGGLSST